MSAIATQRLVPIRPSPHKGLTTVCSDSPSTLTPPKTGIKRKLSDPSPDPVKCKRRINFSVGYVMAQKPAAVARRNARERNRVKQVNNGFATLRQHIPGAAKAKKISKVETLKQAVEYIRSLQHMLDEHDELMSLAASTNTTTNTDNLGNNHVITTSLPFTTGSSSTTTTALSQQSMYRTFQQLQTQYLYSSENLSPVTQSVLGSLGAQVALRPLPSSSLSPTCSDASSVSPVPSYMSEKSFQSTELHPSATSFPPVSEISAFDAFDAYDTVPSATATTTTSTTADSIVTTPEDEELLDVIAFWQQA